MKFFHLSDLHIGKQLHYYSLKDDQMTILKEIAEYAMKLKPEAIVIAGDVYDKSVPSAEAVAVFDGFIRDLSGTGAEILVISGNHDSPERLDFASSLLERQHLHMVGFPPVKPEDHIRKVVLTDENGTVNFWLLPFLKPAYVKAVFEEEIVESYTDAVKKLIGRENINRDERNVLITHQFYTASGKEPERSESETVFVGGTGNVDVSAVEMFDYVAMGHIHKKQSIGASKYRYCGTPLKYSVGEALDEKVLTVVTLGEKGEEPLIEELPLHPVRDVKQYTGELKELLQKKTEDYVSVILTNEKMPYQPREQLDHVFPNLLEVRVENIRTRRQLKEMQEAVSVKNPMELFRDFYKDIHGSEMSEVEEKIIGTILEKAEEEFL